MEQSSFIYTKDKNCLGCNKCIYKCPIGANEAFFEADNGKVFIKDGYCISCGECLSVCDHSARDFNDDIIDFFQALKNGEKISAVIAPAARFNFASTKKLITYLHSIGVNQVYDVSFGADICTWAYVKAIKEQNLSGIIAQPCPVVVSYVEKFKPELISHLSPIQSPVICLVTYLKKIQGITDKIVFISPCIGKKRESLVVESDKTVDYNVTFAKLLDYLSENKIDIENLSETDFSNTPGSLGFAFARPGGLSENVRYHLGADVWIKQIEGIHNIKEYLDECVEDIEQGRPIPTIIDALNCEHGCNLGTGTHKTARQNEIDYVTNSFKQNLAQCHTDELMKHFDDSLNLDDYIRAYVDRSQKYKRDENVDVEEAFLSLGKITEADRNVNCFSCGYGNCFNFVYDLATGHNDKNNCRHYLLNKFKKLSLFDDLTGTKNRNHYNMKCEELIENHTGLVGIVYIDINGLKQANDKFGHAFGDSMIINCANVLKSIFANNIYRIGGDEFVILDTVVALSSFFEKVKDLRNALSLQENLAVSIGVSVSYSSDDFNDKLEEADKKMYIDKQAYYTAIRDADRRNCLK